MILTVIKNYKDQDQDQDQEQEQGTRRIRQGTRIYKLY